MGISSSPWKMNAEAQITSPINMAFGLEGNEQICVYFPHQPFHLAMLHITVQGQVPHHDDISSQAHDFNHLAFAKAGCDHTLASGCRFEENCKSEFLHRVPPVLADESHQLLTP